MYANQMNDGRPTYLDMAVTLILAFISMAVVCWIAPIHDRWILGGLFVLIGLVAAAFMPAWNRPRTE